MATTKPTFYNATGSTLAAPRYNFSDIPVPPGKYVTGDYYAGENTLDGNPTGEYIFEVLGLTDVSSGSDPLPADIVYDYTLAEVMPPDVAVVVPSSVVSAVPVMTSNTTPSGEVSASSYHVSRPPWGAFISPAGGWFNNGEAPPVWIQYSFPEATCIRSIAITPWSLDSFPDRNITAFRVDASDDESNWTTLTTVTKSWPWVQWVKEYFRLDNDISYLHYRLVITATGGNLYTGLQYLELLP